MATSSFVSLYLPEAADLADLQGIAIDLARTRSYAEKLRAFFVDYQTNAEFVEALTVAALVAYVRSFSSGVRTHLGEEALSALSPEQRDLHGILKSIRDKHIAHSVNSFEESQPIARYWVERVDKEGISSIDCQHTRVIALSPLQIDELIALVDALRAHVDSRIEIEKAKLLALVRAQPLSQVLGATPRPPAGNGAPDKKRRRLGR